MPLAQSVTVSFDPIPFSFDNAPPSGGTVPPLILSSWEPPSFAMRLTYFPDQPDVPGKVLESSALDAGTLPMVINVHGTDLADLQNNRRAVEVLFSQFAYTLTITFGTQEEVYNAFPTWPTWELDLDSLTAVATLSVPVNPIGA